MAAKKAAKRAAKKKVAPKMRRAEPRRIPDQSVDAGAYLERKLGRLTFGRTLAAIREGEEMTLREFAEKLGTTTSKLSDYEHGRRQVSLERAAEWARLLGYSESQFVRLALQHEVDKAGLRFEVTLTRHIA